MSENNDGERWVVCYECAGAGRYDDVACLVWEICDECDGDGGWFA